MQELISELRMTEWKEPVFDSFEEAVAFAERSDRAARSQIDNETLKTDSIVDYSMGLDAVEFLLSSRRILRFYLVGDIVDWSLEEGGSFQKMPRIYTDEVRLMAKDKFVADSRPYERLEPLKQIPGLFLGAAQTFVVLEVRGCPGVSFSEMALPDGKSVIFVDGD